jgi:hypothetical protein
MATRQNAKVVWSSDRTASATSGMPAFDPATRRLVLVSPTAPPGSSLIAGVQSFVLSRHCRFVQSWQQVFDPPDAGSAPTIAGGVVYWLRP